jgi:hypothetical protein
MASSVRCYWGCLIRPQSTCGRWVVFASNSFSACHSSRARQSTIRSAELSRCSGGCQSAFHFLFLGDLGRLTDLPFVAFRQLTCSRSASSLASFLKLRWTRTGIRLTGSSLLISTPRNTTPKSSRARGTFKRRHCRISSRRIPSCAKGPNRLTLTRVYNLLFLLVLIRHRRLMFWLCGGGGCVQR